MKATVCSVVLALLALLAVSCHHNEASDMYQVFPIQEELETEQTVLDWAALSSDERKLYPRVSFVVNSREDFPEDNLMGIDALKSMNIDFERHTLLLTYNRVPGLIRGHRYVWRKNLQEGVFELFSDFSLVNPESSGSPLPSDEDSGKEADYSEYDDLMTYVCTGVLVKKLPADAKVIFWFSYY